MKLNTNQIRIIVTIIVLISVGILFYYKNTDINKSEKILNNISTEVDSESKTLKTNMSKFSVPLEKILDGGPGKDGIPALFNPKFISIREAEKDIKDSVDGIVVSVGKDIRFYPYNIIVWHEIVNDLVGDKPLVITFCPLCGSAIVFDTVDQFGVSGKLYESNLLMYDKKTESLWSQSIGTAVVGDRTGEKLTIYPSQVLSFSVFKEKWPNGKVMSTDTGYSRNYNLYPYGDYNDNESIFFPVSINDSRFPAKEMMYVVNAYDHSIAFPLKQIGISPLSAIVNGNRITGQIIDGEIVVKDASGKVLPGYHEMWFSWATHHQEDGIVSKNNE